MDNLRRTVLKGIGASGALTAALAAGVLKPTQVLAAEDWNRTAFEAKKFADALGGIGASAAADSEGITIIAPEIAENGAVVPVGVASDIPNTISIAILSAENPQPLLAALDFANSAVPQIQARVRLARTTDVQAVIKTADGKYFSAKKNIKVTAGGCGG